MTISVMMKTINLAAILMVEHAVTILSTYGTSFARSVNARIQMDGPQHLVQILKKRARKNAKGINVRKVNGARQIAS